MNELSDRLKPCPFCGCNEIGITDYGGIVEITCDGCIAQMDAHYLPGLDDKRKAVQLAEKEWNARV